MELRELELMVAAILASSLKARGTPEERIEDFRETLLKLTESRLLAKHMTAIG